MRSAFEKVITAIHSLPKTKDEFAKVILSIKSVLQDESQDTRRIWEIYINEMSGLHKKDDMAWANEKIRDIFKSLGLGGLIILPGTIFILPIIIGVAHSIGIDILPQWAKDKYKDILGDKDEDKGSPK